MAHAAESLPLSIESIPELSAFPLIALLSLFPVENVEAGIFSRITMTSMTSAWYLPIGHFEALFIALAVLQIFVMRYFLILPLDITKLIDHGTLLATSVSRKKRRALDYQDVVQKQRLAESMFSVLRRLDKDDCVLRALCELEYGINRAGETYSPGITDLLDKLKRLGYRRRKYAGMVIPNNVTIPDRKVLSEFEDAVLFGAGDNTLLCEPTFEDSCAGNFPLCHVDRAELIDYIDKIPVSL